MTWLIKGKTLVLSRVLCVIHIHYVDISESILLHEAFPEYAPDKHPGRALRGAGTEEGIMQKQFSELTGIPQRHISDMENSKRTIGKKMAVRFVRVLD